MKIKFKNVQLNLNLLRVTQKKNDVILFLHGFSGSSNDWEGIINLIDDKFNLAALDLIGHGKSDSPEDLKFYSAESLIEIIQTAVEFLGKQKIIICGYSMGGRAAMNFAYRKSQFIQSLILESTSAGITDESERNLRIKRDTELAQFILQHKIEEFSDYWMNLELFKSQKALDKKIIEKVRSEKLKNSNIGLANSLIGFGTGAMTPLYDNLKKIKIKTLLISGELDSKFTEINKKINELIPNSRHCIINSAGHNAHLENPIQFCQSINSFLLQQ